MMKLVFLVHFAATWYLVGLCWLVQRVQYPLMDRVGVEGYADYERGHVARIGPVVAPMMLIELGTGVALWLSAEPLFRLPGFSASLAILALVWASTFLIQVPLHGRLARGFDASAHARLVRSNWLRTLGWSARGGLLLWLMWVGFLGGPAA